MVSSPHKCIFLVTKISHTKYEKLKPTSFVNENGTEVARLVSSNFFRTRASSYWIFKRNIDGFKVCVYGKRNSFEFSAKLRTQWSARKEACQFREMNLTDKTLRDFNSYPVDWAGSSLNRILNRTCEPAFVSSLIEWVAKQIGKIFDQQ